MMSKFKYKIGRAQLLLTVLVWLLIFTMPLLFGDSSKGINWTHIFKIWKEYGVVFIIFLINRLVLLPFLFFNGKRTAYFSSIFSIIILFSTMLFLTQGKQNIPPPPSHHMPRHEFRPPPPFRGPKEHVPPFANLFIISILIIGFDTGLIFSNKWMQSEQNKLKIEKENIANKMAFLQNQVSPHFFMNTLNNIHALIDISTEEAKAAIIKLSQMMDYMLYESQTDKITVQKEMDFIESFVELMRLRFTEDVDIILNIPATLPQVNIPPLLTISFIENAFKHGISYEAPSFVHIDFNFDKSTMSFKVKNSIHTKKEQQANSGIGIQNSCNRLELIYNNRHELSIKRLKEESFEVILNLPL